jgi:hypothetical protein
MAGVPWAQEAAPVNPQVQSVQRIPGRTPRSTAALQGTVHSSQGQGIPGVNVTITGPGRKVVSVVSDAEGIFRLRDLTPGTYAITAEKPGFTLLKIPTLQLQSGELITIDLRLEPESGQQPTSKGPSGVPGAAQAPGTAERATPTGAYPGLRTAQSQNPPVPLGLPPEQIPPESVNFSKEPYRWDVPMPAWDRYGKPGEFPYTEHHWYDPFNRNRIKGDEPLFGQTWFFDFTGTSLTGLDVRRLPVPSGISAEQEGENQFFGRGEQGFASQSFRLSADLFQGDASFRPVDFRIKFRNLI